jgi:hypothetical protein
MEPGTLYAATARADITPPVGIAHANWGAQAHETAQGVDLALWATVLALRSGDTTAVLVDLDLGGLGAGDATAIREAVAVQNGIPASHVRLAYTHTHSGPSTHTSGGWVKRGAEQVPVFIAALKDKVTGAVWEALQHLEPVRMAAGSGSSKIAVNRRFKTPEGKVVVGHNWEGPVDHEVNVVRFDRHDGSALATLVNYACHPIIVGPYNNLITPDFPGVVKRTVEAAIGGHCLFLQGAAGDVGPVEGCTVRNPLEVYRKLGQRLGYEAVRVAVELESAPRQERYVQTLESGAPLAVYSYESKDVAPVDLRVVTRTARLPLRPFPPFAEAEAEAQQRAGELQALRQQGSEEEIRWAGMRAKRARQAAERSRAYAGKSHAELELHAIRLNNVAIVGTPGEPFVSIGLEVKSSTPFTHTLFSGYSNAGGSYLPMPEDYAHGGYEVDITPYTPEAAAILIDECITLLDELS